MEVEGFDPDYQDETEAEPDIAQVAEDVIEGPEDGPGPGAAVIEGTGIGVDCLCQEDELSRWDGVEDDQERDEVEVSV